MRYATLVLLFAAPLSADEPAKPPTKDPGPTQFEVRLVDNSTLKAVLQDEKLDVQTKYGKLSVPIADVRRIDFGLRLSADAVKKIDALVAELGNPNEQKRADAAAALSALRERAVPALRRAAKGRDAEHAARARELLDQILESIGDDRADPRDEDVIQTDGFTVVGRIETAALKARTTHFGELQLKIADLRGLRSPDAEPDAAAVNALPDPGSLTNYEVHIGKTFYFTVTGAVQGSLWGTDVYTTDSTLALAAVHVGVLKPGQTGVVKVTMLPSPPAFQGSTKNGVTSSGYGVYRAAFKVGKP
jgi:hypothetical protein